jgi:hypothetical protein
MRSWCSARRIPVTPHQSFKCESRASTECKRRSSRRLACIPTNALPTWACVRTTPPREFHFCLSLPTSRRVTGRPSTVTPSRIGGSSPDRNSGRSETVSRLRPSRGSKSSRPEAGCSSSSGPYHRPTSSVGVLRKSAGRPSREPRCSAGADQARLEPRSDPVGDPGRPGRSSSRRPRPPAEVVARAPPSRRPRRRALHARRGRSGRARPRLRAAV